MKSGHVRTEPHPSSAPQKSLKLKQTINVMKKLTLLALACPDTDGHVINHAVLTDGVVNVMLLLDCYHTRQGGRERPPIRLPMHPHGLSAILTNINY